MVVVHQKAALGLGLGQTHAGISDTGKEREKVKIGKGGGRKPRRKKGMWGGSHHNKKLFTLISIFSPSLYMLAIT